MVIQKTNEGADLLIQGSGNIFCQLDDVQHFITDTLYTLCYFITYVYIFIIFCIYLLEGTLFDAMHPFFGQILVAIIFIDYFQKFALKPGLGMEGD